MRKPYANNKKGTDQSAHLHSLISTFVVRCLDSTSKAFIKKLASPLAITISVKTLMVDNP